MQKFEFPKGFFWGAATASYQIEGGIDNNDWARAGRDGFVPIAGSAANSYDRYEEDFDIAKSLGHNAHRFSIEWSRIEPKEGFFDEDEIEHYRKVIKALHERELTPFITLWHFTLPEWFVEKGGFTKRKNIKYFSRYCSRVVSALSDESAHWATFNEPMVYSSNGWMRGSWPPFKFGHFTTMIRVIDNLARAHKEAYKAMKKADPSSDIGIVKNNIYFHSNSNPWNLIKSRFVKWFWNYRFLNKIKNHCDSIGINYYFHSEYNGGENDYPKSDMGWDLFPEGLYHVLMEVKKYDKPIYVAEAGLADERDKNRGWYIKELVYNIHRAIEDGVDLRGYMYWSLVDNYEWAFGFQKRFGLVEIDYKTKERRVRDSAYEYKKICQSNALIRE